LALTKVYVLRLEFAVKIRYFETSEKLSTLFYVSQSLRRRIFEVVST